jgi:hypothetical protein
LDWMSYLVTFSLASSGDALSVLQILSRPTRNHRSTIRNQLAHGESGSDKPGQHTVSICRGATDRGP